MKKSIALVTLTFLFAGFIYSQDAVTKSGRLRDLAVKQVVATTFDNEGKPYIIFFWSTSNPASGQMLNIIAAKYADWQKETGVKIITVAVDDVQNAAKVGSFIQSNKWVYENYLDQGQDYMNVMHVNNVPYVFVFNGRKEITFQFSYNDGDETAIYDALKKTVN